jgi:hypothetical protein
MTAHVISFPQRAPFAVHVTREDAAWLVLVGAHGWLFGSHFDAHAEARWLSKNLALPIQEISKCK